MHSPSPVVCRDINPEVFMGCSDKFKELLSWLEEISFSIVVTVSLQRTVLTATSILFSIQIGISSVCFGQQSSPSLGGRARGFSSWS